MRGSVLFDEKSVLLEQIRFFAQHRIQAEAIDDMAIGGTHAVEMVRDFVTKGYLLQLRSKFHGKKQDIELDPVPVSWWEHFKRDAIPTFSRWLRLPVREERRALRAGVVFPDVPQIPGNRFYWHEIHPLETTKGDGDE